MHTTTLDYCNYSTQLCFLLFWVFHLQFHYSKTHCSIWIIALAATACAAIISPCSCFCWVLVSVELFRLWKYSNGNMLIYSQCLLNGWNQVHLPCRCPSRATRTHPRDCRTFAESNRVLFLFLNWEYSRRGWSAGSCWRRGCWSLTVLDNAQLHRIKLSVGGEHRRYFKRHDSTAGGKLRIVCFCAGINGRHTVPRSRKLIPTNRLWYDGWRLFWLDYFFGCTSRLQLWSRLRYVHLRVLAWRDLRWSQRCRWWYWYWLLWWQQSQRGVCL